MLDHRDRLMSGEYILTATSWRDAEGVRHRRGDVVTPPASEVDRLLRAKAIATPEEIAEAEAAAEAARQAQEAAQAAADRADAADGVSEAPSDGLDGAVPPEVTPPNGKPRKVAPVKEWEDYAVALHEASGGKEGFPRADAEAMSKAELIEALQ